MLAEVARLSWELMIELSCYPAFSPSYACAFPEDLAGRASSLRIKVIWFPKSKICNSNESNKHCKKNPGDPGSSP